MAAITRSNTRQLSLPPEDLVNGRLAANTAVDYTDNHVNGKLHEAFGPPEAIYNEESDSFLERSETIEDEKGLSDSQRAFSEALQDYERDAEPKFKTGIDLKAVHTWDEVVEKVESACEEYKGVGKKGILTSIRCGLRNFHTAAPSIQAWLKLLPSTSEYGSVVCGGLTIILEAAIRLGQLREDTYMVLDQIPLQVEKAGALMKVYRNAKMRKQAADLYRAILDALQHILLWYKEKATMKYLGSFVKGTVYAAVLKAKMKAIEEVSQMMDDHAAMRQHMRIRTMGQGTIHNRTQLDNLEKTTGEVKELALEARNALYAVFKDTEAYAEVVQFWAATRAKSEQRRADVAHQKGNAATRDKFLTYLNHSPSQLSRDIEDAIRQIFLIPLTDQDRAVAIIQNPIVEDWIVEPHFSAILIHANSRRHEPISPASVACAMLVHVFSKMASSSDGSCRFITLYWFCGSHAHGKNDDALSLMRSLICQLLVAGPVEDGFEQIEGFDGGDIEKVFAMFKGLLRQLPSGTVVVCLIDGISYYEDSNLREDTLRIVKKLVKASGKGEPIFKLLITSPTRTAYVHQEPAVVEYIRVVEIPQRVLGSKMGFNHRAVVMETERKAERLSLNLPGSDQAEGSGRGVRPGSDQHGLIRPRGVEPP